MKVAIYCRLSEEDRNKRMDSDDSESIQNQKSMLLQYAIDKEWQIYNIYSDDDYTGADRNRPEFKKLIEDAEKGKFNVILCKTQSRFTREMELVEKYIHGLFPVWGIRFISVVDNADTENKGNKKSRQINGLVNEWYLEDMSESIKSVLTDKRKKGLHIGAFALYGYKKDPNQKGHLIIDEEAAEVVREVFHLFSQGYGKTAIARILNDRNIPNPTEYKRQKGFRYMKPKSSNSTLWKYYSIADMLINEIYIGNMVQGKYGSISYKSKKNKPRDKADWYIVENTHEPIIERELWDKVQQMVMQRAKPFRTGEIGLFARKVRCMNCGYTMRSSKTENRYYLKCCTRHISKNSCIGAFISVKKLEQTVLIELNSILEDNLDKEKIARSIERNNGYLKKKQKLESALRIYIKKQEEIEKVLKELYLDKVKQVITADQYVEFAASFGAEQSHFKQLIKATRLELDALSHELQKETDKKQIVEQYATLKQLDRAAVEELIECVYVGKKDAETGAIPIEIHWNF